MPEGGGGGVFLFGYGGPFEGRAPARQGRLAPDAAVAAALAVDALLAV